MTDYRTIEQNILIDQLSKFTADYTKLLTENGSREQIDNLKKEIIAIQKEINYREKFRNYSGSSKDYITSDNDIV